MKTEIKKWRVMTFYLKKKQNNGAIASLKKRKYVIGNMVIVFFISALISRYKYQLVLIQGNSMEPSFHNLQFTIIKKDYDELFAGDVIAFKCEGLGCVLIKRIIGLPGQRVEIKNGKVYADKRELKYYKNQIVENSGFLEKEIFLMSDEYVVMGDNIDESIDSRFPEVGIVRRDSILGKVIE